MIKRIGHVLTQKEKKYAIGLAIAILLAALLEVAGVASILPFMELIAAPKAIGDNAFLSYIYESFHFENHRSMLIASGIFVIALLTIANLFSIVTIWFQHRFTWYVAHHMCMRLLDTYIRKPYTFFLNQNTSELKSYLIFEVNGFTSGVIQPLIELISRSVVSFVIFVFLVLVNPKVALVAFVVLGGAYGAIFLLRQRYIKQLGEDRMSTNVNRYRYMEELLSGIKTVKAYNAQPYFHGRYETASEHYSSIAPKFSVITAAPKYLLEIIAFGGILSVTLYIYTIYGNLNAALPILSLYAVAGYKLLPALQKAFGAASKVRHNLPILDKLYDDLVISIERQRQRETDQPNIDFQDVLTLENIHFRYDGMAQDLLSDFTIHIPKGQAVAFVGSTGSGKTTIIDLIVGLLEAQSGQIKLDKTVLTRKNLAAWQRHIAYVPQDVFLYDDTITNNIIFGADHGKVDAKKLRAAIEMADIAEFIDTELPEGLETTIGERGVRLSGGQRQRIGLARALYREPSVLILDEATSALDNVTEKSIIDALNALPKELTLIIIAHRLTTVQYADCIYILDKGQIVDSGNYDQLMKTSTHFRELALLDNF
ncbi:MAG: ABC transporter ATP-binding protein [Bacteroidota bacterium]